MVLKDYFSNIIFILILLFIYYAIIFNLTPIITFRNLQKNLSSSTGFIVRIYKLQIHNKIIPIYNL